MSVGGQPDWIGKHGTPRIIAEYRYLFKLVQKGHESVRFIKDLALVDENENDPTRWRILLHKFDEDCKGGKDLNADLANLYATSVRSGCRLHAELSAPCTSAAVPSLSRASRRVTAHVCL